MITIDDRGGKPTVNARELHVFLEVKRDFSNWIKDQIDRARLIEDRDYVSRAEKGERAIGGTTRIEYHLGLDAADHICMLSQTEKGHTCRQYFIDYRNKSLMLNPEEMLLKQAQMMVEHRKRFEEQDKKIKALQCQQDAIQKGNEFFSVIAYCKLIGVVCNNASAQRIGRMASRISRTHGIPMGKARHEHYGEVHTYYEKVLEKTVFILTDGRFGTDHSLEEEGI